MIPRIKNDVLLYESYIPPKIKTVVADFVSFLQDEVTFWGLYCEILFGVKDDHINIDAAKAKCEESLRFCALIETMIYSRLKELSGDDKRRTKNS